MITAISIGVIHAFDKSLPISKIIKSKAFAYTVSSSFKIDVIEKHFYEKKHDLKNYSNRFQRECIASLMKEKEYVDKLINKIKEKEAKSK